MMSDYVFNPERGEVELVLGGERLVLAAQMRRLASLSGHFKCDSFEDLYNQMMKPEPNSIIATLEHLCVHGDVNKAIDGFKMIECNAVMIAFRSVLEHHLSDDDKKQTESTSQEKKT
jgi:hypothetical protein